MALSMCLRAKVPGVTQKMMAMRSRQSWPKRYNPVMISSELFPLQLQQVPWQTWVLGSTFG
eukprot:5445400-Amphidinium_carterae.1